MGFSASRKMPRKTNITPPAATAARAVQMMTRRSLPPERESGGTGRYGSRPRETGPGVVGPGSLAFDQPNVAGARSLCGVLYGEFHALTFPQKLEDGAANRA